jgi:hypothetical protein
MQERAEYTVDTENDLRTALRVSGSSNCDIPLMMSQVCVCIHVCMYVCIYSTYLYIYIYIHMYVYTA